MQSEIFDKETMLDLMVNFIPLGIILFFIGVFSLFAPWGFDVRNWGVMFAIMAIMFVALAILTYISAKAIAGDEKQKPVYPQGQAGLKGAKTVHELEAEMEASEADTIAETVEDDPEASTNDSVVEDASVDPTDDGPADESDHAEAAEAEPGAEPGAETEAVDTETEPDTETDASEAAVDDADDDEPAKSSN